MLRLGVNIDHVATLRQARYKDQAGGLVPEPSVLTAAATAEAAGADGITVHLREDRRHIQDADVRALRQALHARLNLELADVPEIVGIATEIKPDEACLVPERRLEVTTEGGLNVRRAQASLTVTVARLRQAGVVVSMFVDPDDDQLRASADVGAQFVELHTGAYANATGAEQTTELRKLFGAAERAHALGLRVNAGHGLNYENVKPIRALPHLDTLNIGHAIVARAVFVGLRQAVTEMRAAMRP